MGRPHRPHRRRDATARSLHGLRLRRRRRPRSRRSRLQTGRTRDVSPHRRRREARAALAGLHVQSAGLQLRLGDRALRVATGPEFVAAEPHRCPECAPSALVQHRGQLRHQHELAELHAREHGQPPDPDGRARDAELRFRSRRHFCSRLRSYADSPAGGRPLSGTSGSTSRAPSLASSSRSRSSSP